MSASVLLAVLALAGAEPERGQELLGHSALGRPIRAVVLHGRREGPTVLAVGCIHGTECAGIAVTRLLARGAPPPAGALWLLHQLNPDGHALGVRQNGRGVDLNRNFPVGWLPLGRRWDPQYAGPRPLSEPETRLARRLVRRLRPDVTIWYHQPTAFVRAWGPSVPAARRYARAAGVPFRRLPWLAGTAPNWQNNRFRGSSSFVVELPPGPLSSGEAARHARAVLALLAARHACCTSAAREPVP